MLSTLLKEHQARQQTLRDETEHKRKLAVQSVGVVTNLLVEDLNSGVATVFDNQKKIEAEAKKLQTQVAKFSKQTSQWLQLVEEFNTALKEIGDIENWSKNIEQDMLAVTSSLEHLQKSRTMV